MKRRQYYQLRVLLFVIAGAFVPSSFGGMTFYDLNDVVRLRLEEISFFAVILVLCAFGIRALWNVLANDFSWLPKLDFKKAMALTTLLGLMMLLVLSMISGARELMTPGAWNRQGSAYRLNTAANEEQRRIGMEELRSALFKYAGEHGGKFPAHDYVPEISQRIWTAPDIQGTRYVYFGGRKTNDVKEVLACEPKRFGDRRFVLMGNGEIKTLRTEEIQGAIAKEP